MLSSRPQMLPKGRNQTIASCFINLLETKRITKNYVDVDHRNTLLPKTQVCRHLKVRN